MDKNGHLQGVKCERCYKVLNADGNHPAETYAGTFNGLCYTCTSAAPYVAKTFKDGAVLMSHPPSCPSHRRDRALHYAYPDCSSCKGLGRRYVSRASALGGSYTSYCEPCLTRFLAYPPRKCLERRHKLLDALAQARYNRLRLAAAESLRREGLGHLVVTPPPRRGQKKYRGGPPAPAVPYFELPEDVNGPIAVACLVALKRARAKLEQLAVAQGLK